MFYNGLWAWKYYNYGSENLRIRELCGMKQEALAHELGNSEQSVLHIEQSETLNDAKLEEVAKVLDVTKEAIVNFSDEAVFNYFNSFSDNSVNQGLIGA